jgi:hypothetical protein
MDAKKSLFGMTLPQVIVLAVLALVACTVIGILGIMIVNSTPATTVQPIQPTYTLQPSPMPTATTTPWPTVTPIQNWQPYSFSSGQAHIWLPNSYLGGDTQTSSTEIMTNLRATLDDEEFAASVQNLVENPDVIFFALDTDLTDVIKFVYVGQEALNPDVSLSMDAYLNQALDNIDTGTGRLIERQIIQFDSFPTGKLVFESKVPAGDVEVFVSIAVYTIRVDNTMWFITFRTGRQDYLGYKETMDAIVQSFWVQNQGQ